MPENQNDETEPDPAALVLADIMGRILAMQSLVTRLFASHAEMFPTGVASRMLSDIDAVVESMDVTMPPGFVLDAAKVYIRDYLEKSQNLLDSGLEAKEEE